MEPIPNPSPYVPSRALWFALGGAFATASILGLQELALNEQTPDQQAATTTVTTEAPETAVTSTTVIPEAATTTTTPTPDVTTPIENGETVLTPWAEFVKPNEISDETIQGLIKTTLRVDTGSGVCTGRIINDLLVTAAHCEDKLPDSIKLFVMRDGRAVTVAVPSRWAFQESSDLLIAPMKPDDYLQPVDRLLIDSFNNAQPTPGEQFVVVSLEEDGTPLVTWLTYLGFNEAEANGDYIFAVDPGTTQEAAEHAIRPGVSGASLSNGYNQILALFGHRGPKNRDGTPNEDWQGDKAYYGKMFDVDLTNVPMLVYASHLEQPLVDELVATAKDQPLSPVPTP